MTLALIIGISTLVVTSFLSFITIRRAFLYIQEQKRIVYGIFQGENNEFSKQTVAIIDYAFERVKERLNFGTMATKAAVRKQEGNVVKDVISSQSPALGIALDFLPKTLINKIANNPIYAQAAANMIGNGGLDGLFSGVGGNGNHETKVISPNFEL